MGGIGRILSLDGLRDSVRTYSLRKFRSDFVAGLTVAVIDLPQAMAYALIAGVPPQYGIYTTVIQGVIGALLSTSQRVTTGPTNTQSLLIASAVARAMGADQNPEIYLQLVFCLTLMKGLIQIGFALARFGDLVRFISRSVILGVASGAGVLIIVGQIGALIGIERDHASRLPGVVGAIASYGSNLAHPNMLTLAIGAACIAIVIGGRFISKFVPGALIAVVLSAAAVAVFGWSDQVRVVGEVAGGLPDLIWPIFPDWGLVSALIPGALALAMMGGIEAIAIGKTLAHRTGDRINANQEFLAQGAAGLVGSFTQCMPASGSFTRSALIHDAGAASRFAAVIDALLVGVIFFSLAYYAQFIPLAALAAVLFVVALGLIDFRYPFRTWQADRSDAVVFLATFLATLLLPLEYAIFAGIFLNIAFYLRSAARLHIAEMVPTDTGTFFERPIYDKAGNRQVIFVQLEGELFFAVADDLHDQLTALRNSGVRVVILRLKRTHSIDASILHVLELFVREMRDRNGHVLLCGLKPDLKRQLAGYGLINLIGKDNVFETGGGVFTSAKRAVERARKLVDRSIDTTHLKLDDEDEIEYQI